MIMAGESHRSAAANTATLRPISVVFASDTLLTSKKGHFLKLIVLVLIVLATPTLRMENPVMTGPFAAMENPWV